MWNNYVANMGPASRWRFPLSPKYIDFINTTNVRAEFLEGTTASGKTTVGAGVKFMRMVSASKRKLHVLAAKTTGKAEETIIQQDNGILDIHSDAAYFGNGDKDYKLPHIKFEGKIIYVLGYDNKDKWQNVLGAQFGCVYIDEINTANIDFVREISTRNDYLLATLNPDDPALPIYKEFVNRSRPFKKYANDVPAEILSELKEEPVQGWRYWFFSFRDNLSLTAEDIERKKAAAPKGTKLYKNKIEGLRGRATGLVFSNFDRQHHVMREADLRRCVTGGVPPVSTSRCNFKYAESALSRQVEDSECEIVQCGHAPRDASLRSLTSYGANISERAFSFESYSHEHFIQFSAGLDTAYSQKSPDTIAMSYIGITNRGRLFLLEEQVYNNADMNTPLAPSDTAVRLVQFLDRCRDKWEPVRNVFIDSADQATITELYKYKRKTGCAYIFQGAWKKTKIIDRINLQLGWFAQGKMIILDHCRNYISELELYSWKEDKDNEPEDGHDHMINSAQYAFLPYVEKIGG